ncbi:YbjQ family protein [Mitsuaria sp. WAJ17]|uniref:YbjQ family protein n=1 Tax=Mitsuaria sp. WAJ17 TaxID=2761452 RepID=UPI001603CC8A|nr:YbjQ family protein [Mitsuaria sp. WAJ17]MBB2487789.1 YbjQ family protein [Mitsuaria sp. WAJ17]
MITTTTTSIDGATISRYLGIVTGEVILGTHLFSDMAADFRDRFGGRVGGYERNLAQARSQALRKMQTQAMEQGGNAVVGVKLDYETVGPQASLLMVTACGTAVLAERVGPAPSASGGA